jgi:hypothetical protein
MLAYSVALARRAEQFIPVAAATVRSGNTRQTRSRQDTILRQMVGDGLGIAQNRGYELLAVNTERYSRSSVRVAGWSSGSSPGS